jgi:hypothetical protein
LPVETLRPQPIRTVDTEQRVDCLAVDFDRREHRLFCLISLTLRAQAFSESSRSVASEIGQKLENRVQTPLRLRYDELRAVLIDRRARNRLT